ncbi:MAG: hypothetical protein JSU77_00420 [Fidelibacterota bacterium]|nr:MAG: hypothetical protein JSU77_00420 [Candidatus Neomarinimicrobiota bacterium]
MKAITRLRIYKTFHYITAPPQEVIFSPLEPRPQRLLFLFPIKKEWLAESRYVFQRLKRHLPDNPIQLAVASTYRDQIAGPIRSTFYFPMTPDRPSRILMDVMLARFRDRSFDAVINLEPELNFQMARVMSVIRTPRRIGFTGPYADDLYNIQIHSDFEGGLEGAYEQILSLCNIGFTDNGRESQP